jgi:hypothetical protein
LPLCRKPLRNKFSYLNINRTRIKSWPPGVSGILVVASLSTSSWNRHAADCNSLASFAQHANFNLAWPLKLDLVRGYVNWALTKKKLSPNTIKIYLSDLNTTHKIRSVESKLENDFFIKAMLKGTRNVSLYSNITKKSKFLSCPFHY